MQPGPLLPYSRHAIDEDDIAAVTAVLRGDWLTTGPAVRAFEETLERLCAVPHAVSCSNGTAALHLTSLALGLGPDHTVIVPAITFAATANAPRLTGAEVCFADCDPENGLMRPEQFEEAIARVRHNGRNPAAVFPVDLAGQCGDIETIADIARRENIAVVEDSCHAIGAEYLRRDGTWAAIGSCADSDITVFSFHPVKTIAAGEGGAAVTRDAELARKLARFRNHGVNRETAQTQANPWYYEMVELGLNYRLSDINCALARSQLGKLDRFVAERRRLAALYDIQLTALAPVLRPIKRSVHCRPAWHLYSVLIDFDATPHTRGQLMHALEARGIRTQVHYIPVHRHPYYRERYGETSLPGAEAYYRQTLSLPLYVGMTDSDVERVVAALTDLLGIQSLKRGLAT